MQRVLYLFIGWTYLFSASLFAQEDIWTPNDRERYLIGTPIRRPDVSIVDVITGSKANLMGAIQKINGTRPQPVLVITTFREAYQPCNALINLMIREGLPAKFPIIILYTGNEANELSQMRDTIARYKDTKGLYFYAYDRSIKESDLIKKSASRIFFFDPQGKIADRFGGYDLKPIEIENALQVLQVQKVPTTDTLYYAKVLTNPALSKFALIKSKNGTAVNLERVQINPETSKRVLIRKGTYQIKPDVNPIADGIFEEFYPVGSKKARIEMRDNIVQSAQTWRENGSKIYDWNVVGTKGYYKEYFGTNNEIIMSAVQENGKLLSKTSYSDGLAYKEVDYVQNSSGDVYILRDGFEKVKNKQIEQLKQEFSQLTQFRKNPIEVNQDLITIPYTIKDDYSSGNKNIIVSIFDVFSVVDIDYTSVNSDPLGDRITLSFVKSNPGRTYGKSPMPGHPENAKENEPTVIRFHGDKYNFITHATFFEYSFETAELTQAKKLKGVLESYSFLWKDVKYSKGYK